MSLKNKDEIFNSINRKKTTESPVRFSTEKPPEPPTAPEPAQVEEQAVQEDNNPLDFSKYKIPMPAIKPRHAAPAIPQQARAPLTEPAAVQPQPVPKQESVEEKVVPGALEQEATEIAVQEYTFPSLDEEPLPAAQQEPSSQVVASEDENDYKQFMDKLSHAFERRIGSAFGDETEPQRDAAAKEFRPKGPQAAKIAEILADEALPLADEGDRQAESFLRSFGDEVQGEEPKPLDFKDALTEKYMRERQKYVESWKKHGGVEEPQQLQEQPEEAPQELPPITPKEPAVRRLNLQIDPAMHVAEAEEKRFPSYSRAFPGAPAYTMAEPMQKAAAASKIQGFAWESTSKKPASKKKPSAAPTGGKASKPVAAAQPEQAVAGKRQIHEYLLPAAVTLLVLALILIPFGLLVRGGGKEAEDFSRGLQAGESFQAYETRIFSPQAQYQDVFVKKQGILLQNLRVSNYVVIEEIASSGFVALEDAQVDGTIYLRDSGLDTLRLKNVVASRIIIKNPSEKLTLELEGNTDIGVVEVQSPTAINQERLAADAAGVRSLLAKSEAAGEVILANVQDMTVRTEGDTVLTLQNATVRNLAAKGSLALSGKGQVLLLSAEAEEGKPLSLQLRDVGVDDLTLAAPAELMSTAPIGQIATGYDLNLSGKALVSSLSLNPMFGNSRLLVDITGGTVNSLFVNTPARIHTVSSGTVVFATANESAYLLGTKVNQLNVKADGVIYENLPDRVVVSNGIQPPGTVADNPNLDYDLRATAGSASATYVETACGHTGEEGGFAEGDGSKENPFQISNAAQLAHIGSHLSSHYIQTADIDFTQENAFAAGFPGIASSGDAFSGSYNGNGYRIRGLTIASGGQYVGLFGQNTGSIHGVALLSGEVKGTGEGAVHVGGIVGINYNGGTVTSSWNGARVVGGKAAYVGGIAGYNFNGRISDCYNNGSVSGPAANLGGIVGVNRDGATIASSYNTGLLEGEQAGAIVGTNTGSVVTNCYYLAASAPNGIGQGTGTVTEREDDEMKSPQLVADLSVGRSDSLWSSGTGNYLYPILAIENKAAQPADVSGQAE